jgi:hypothetical protein
MRTGTPVPRAKPGKKIKAAVSGSGAYDRFSPPKNNFFPLLFTLIFTTFDSRAVEAGQGGLQHGFEDGEATAKKKRQRRYGKTQVRLREVACFFLLSADEGWAEKIPGSSVDLSRSPDHFLKVTKSEWWMQRLPCAAFALFPLPLRSGSMYLHIPFFFRH